MTSERLVETILNKVKYSSRYTQLKQRLDKLLETATTRKWTEQNTEKRKLYADIEILRLDIEGEILRQIQEHQLSHFHYDTDKAYLTAAEKLDQLNKHLALHRVSSEPHHLISKVYKVFRFITFVFYFVLSMTVMMVLIPLRWVHPLLRKLGAPNESLPMDIIQRYFSRGALYCLSVQVIVDGVPDDTIKRPTICMFSHSSNLDAMIVQGYSTTCFKFIGKKVIFMIPIVGWVGRWGFGSIPINRSNRKKAVESLSNLALSVHHYGRSIAISPEGTRTTNGLMLPFKKGPFYLQEDAKIPITPTFIVGAYELWSPKDKFSQSGKVLLRTLPQFHPNPEHPREITRSNLRRQFLEASKASIPADISTAPDVYFQVGCFCFQLVVWYCAMSFVPVCSSIVSSIGFWTGLGWSGTWWLLGLLGVLFELSVFVTC